MFFFASPAASAAYLTVSELFPVAMRGLAIALFYAVGTAAGGLLAPALFGVLIASGSRVQVALGDALGAALMLLAAGVAAWLGVPAERKSLETKIRQRSGVWPASWRRSCAMTSSSACGSWADSDKAETHFIFKVYHQPRP